MTRAMVPVILNRPTVEVLQGTVARVEFPPEATAAVGAALVRGSFRTEDDRVFETLLTKDEIPHVWAVLQAFIERDPLFWARPESREYMRWVVGAVVASQQKLVEAASSVFREEKPRAQGPTGMTEGGWKRYRKPKAEQPRPQRPRPREQAGMTEGGWKRYRKPK